jgi:YgiT-type zinc finger domain-containing protein
MQWDEFGRQWQLLTEDVLSGMQDWRTAHPKATFAEIEAAVDERLSGMRARMLEAAALASAAADVSGSTAGERPACPECGQALAARGQRERTLRVPGEQTVALRRSYAVCPACGAGLFPPG